MSLPSFFRREAAPAPPARITIRRRLLGRGSRLRTAGLAAGLLGLGLASVQPARAATYSWNGMPGDWFSNPSNWTLNSLPAAYPGAGDDAQNLTTASMTLGQSTTVNSFLSYGAFTLNGGTFSGNKANAASTLQVNNVFTLNGGQINNFTIQAGTKQAGQPAPSLVVTGNGNNTIYNSVVNANVDLATNTNAFLGIQGTVTENGAISLGTTSNGLELVYQGAALNLGTAGSLTGFGNVFEYQGTTLNSAGTINANASGQTLSLTQSNTISSGILEATNGGILSLNNTTANSGKLIATGGGIVNLHGTITGAAGSSINSAGGRVNVQGATLLGTLNGVGTSKLVFDNNGGNVFSNTVANINLDLATNASAFLNVQGTSTVNGAISLGTTSNGLELVYQGADLTLGSAGSLTGFGSVYQYQGTTLDNNGTVNANSSGNTLALQLSTFNNNAGATAEATAGGILSLNNSNTNNNGTLAATGGGTVNFVGGTVTSAAGSSINSAGGTVNVQGATLLGTLNGVGTSKLVFDNNGGNVFSNTVANINLDLATNASAFLNVQGASTVNGAISLGTTSNGLELVYQGADLTLGSAGSLTGFGSVYQYQGTTLDNNGTVNANSSGNSLNMALSTFNNNGLTEATGGGILVLNNTNTNNNGKLVATGGGTVNFVGGTVTSAAGSSINSAGGTVNVQGATLLGTLNGVGASKLVFDNNGGNVFSNTVANINLDLATNASAFLNVQGASTVNGAISLGTTSNGLELVYQGADLTLGSAGSLTGFGSVYQYQGTTLDNNGTINATANGQATPQTLNIGLSAFNNNGLTEATGGSTLILNNTNTSANAGSTLKADGTGSAVVIQGTFTGAGNNRISATNGGQVQVNGADLLGTINTDPNTALVFNNNGGNAINSGSNGTTVNGNLDLATNANAFLSIQGASTVNGAIRLGTTSNGLQLAYQGATLNLGTAGSLTGFGTVSEYQGTTLNNGGTVSANVANQTLNINTSNFNNAATGTTNVANGAALNVTSNATNSGSISVIQGGTASFSSGLTQTAGATNVFGTLNASEALKGGVLEGFGKVVGNVTNTGGIVQSTTATGLVVQGNFTQTSGGELDAFFGNNFHDLLTVTGQTVTGGTLGVFDLDQTKFTGTGSTGSQFTFLNYSGTLTPNGSIVNGFTQYFSNEIPDSGVSGKILGQNGFVYELFNDTANKQLQLQVLTVGAPVPEASTTVSFGLLLALGLGGLVVASKRKKKA